nr:MAG TPA: hypothetical protein [Microviridae sp.]
MGFPLQSLTRCAVMSPTGRSRPAGDELSSARPRKRRASRRLYAAWVGAMQRGQRLSQ